jgi:hypothetical protein
LEFNQEMVCLIQEINKADIEERRVLLGLSVERAEFLAACSHNDAGEGRPMHLCRVEKTIPYLDLPLLKEAHRLGIGLKDTADMFGWTVEKVASYGIPFRKTSIAPRTTGTRPYNLFPPENE